MNSSQKAILAIIASTAWIGFSEFVRNELLFKDFWLDHFDGLGLAFPSETVNSLVWGVWSLAMSLLIFTILTKFSRLETTAIVWFSSFLMMWLVVGNLSVLPTVLLIYAIPLSILEVYVATVIIEKIYGSNSS